MFNKIPVPYAYPRIKSIIYRAIVVVCTGMLSILVPNFGMFLDFSGAFSMTFLAFIMPVSQFITQIQL
jgi:type II secretory pathway component PulF